MRIELYGDFELRWGERLNQNAQGVAPPAPPSDDPPSDDLALRPARRAASFAACQPSSTASILSGERPRRSAFFSSSLSSTSNPEGPISKAGAHSSSSNSSSGGNSMSSPLLGSSASWNCQCNRARVLALPKPPFLAVNSLLFDGLTPMARSRPPLPEVVLSCVSVSPPQPPPRSTHMG